MNRNLPKIIDKLRNILKKRGQKLPPESALRDAVRQGLKEKVELLISKGADVNAKDYYGKTALHFAVTKSKELVEYLISKGADVNAEDCNDGTPLHSAAIWFGKKDVFELLIFKGADVNAKDHHGKTALHYTVSHGAKELVELLISEGADVNAEDNNDRTPLHYAALWYGTEEVGELLISKGADVNAKDYHGKTALHYAVSRESKELVEYLISKGADINSEDDDNRKPLDCVTQSRKKVNREMVDLLKSKGAGAGDNYSFDVDVLNIKSDRSELTFYLRNSPGAIIFNHHTKEVIAGDEKFCDYGQINRWENSTEIRMGDDRDRIYPEFTLKDINGNEILLLSGNSFVSWKDPSSDDREWIQFEQNKEILKKVCSGQGWLSQF